MSSNERKLYEQSLKKWCSIFSGHHFTSEVGTHGVR